MIHIITITNHIIYIIPVLYMAIFIIIVIGDIVKVPALGASMCLTATVMTGKLSMI